MAQPPEIIAAEDTPSELITVVDETTVRAEVEAWRAKMLKRPGLWDKATRGTQDRINRIIPERVHAIVTAGVEGGVAGAGGFVLAAADFPALMAIKVRMLGDVVGAYGWGGDTVRERLFLLHIFHLAFASAKRRPEALAELERWIAGVDQPEAITEYDWRRFQIEYRDYIDLAKLAQLLPVVGAPIGAVVNWRLVDRLGETAIMACRMRWLGEAAPPA